MLNPPGTKRRRLLGATLQFKVGCDALTKRAPISSDRADRNCGRMLYVDDGMRQASGSVMKPKPVYFNNAAIGSASTWHEVAALLSKILRSSITVREAQNHGIRTSTAGAPPDWRPQQIIRSECGRSTQSAPPIQTW